MYKTFFWVYLRAFICVYSPLWERHLLLRNLHFTAQAFSVSAFLATLLGNHTGSSRSCKTLFNLLSHTHTAGDCLIFGIIWWNFFLASKKGGWVVLQFLLIIIILHIEGSVLLREKTRPVASVVKSGLSYVGLHTFFSCSVSQAVIFAAMVVQERRLHSFYWNTASFVHACYVKMPQLNPPFCFKNPSAATLWKWFCSVHCKAITRGFP